MMGGMFRWLFSSRTRIREFLASLESADLYVIAATQSEGIDAGSLDRDKLLAEINREMERDREAQKSGYHLFTYKTPTGEHRLPFFTSDKAAQRFCSEYSRERNKVFPFMVLQTKGRFLGRINPESVHIVVMNDKNPDERVLKASELAWARKLWG